jgi:hypothetical protein
MKLSPSQVSLRVTIVNKEVYFVQIETYNVNGNKCFSLFLPFMQRCNKAERAEGKFIKKELVAGLNQAHATHFSQTTQLSPFTCSELQVHDSMNHCESENPVPVCGEAKTKKVHKEKIHSLALVLCKWGQFAEICGLTTCKSLVFLLIFLSPIHARANVRHCHRNQQRYWWWWR